MHDKEDLSNELTSQKFVIFLSKPRHGTAHVLHGQVIIAHRSINNVSQIKMSNLRHEFLLSCQIWEVAIVALQQVLRNQGI